MLGTNFDQGVLNHSVKNIFQFIEENSEDRDITVWASYMEIYNEQINDLLDINNVNLKLRECPTEGYYVQGLKLVKIKDLGDFKQLLKMGEKARHYR